MASMQIQDLADKCVKVFIVRILAYGDVQTEKLEAERQVLETQNARFNLWADNIGN
jgi:hypothetical protein